MVEHVKVVVTLRNIGPRMSIADPWEADVTFAAMGSSVLTLTPSFPARLGLQRSICAPVSAMPIVVIWGLWSSLLGWVGG